MESDPERHRSIIRSRLKSGDPELWSQDSWTAIPQLWNHQIKYKHGIMHSRKQPWESSSIFSSLISISFFLFFFEWKNNLEMKISPIFNVRKTCVVKWYRKKTSCLPFWLILWLVRGMAPGRSIASARLVRKAILFSLVLSKSSETATKFLDRF